MPKLVFWPAAILTLGLIYLASAMGYLPAEFHFLWPIVMIVVGLGGLLTSDREEWLVYPSKKKTVTPVAKTKKVSTRRR
jgi:multisubunit Na+/H+ antiporter MnhB subunit